MWPDVLPALSCTSRLRRVRVAACGTFFDGGPALAHALARHSALEELEVSGTRLDDDGARALSELFRALPHMRSLLLRDTHIGCEGSLALARHLTALTTALTQFALTQQAPVDDEVTPMCGNRTQRRARNAAKTRLVRAHRNDAHCRGSGVSTGVALQRAPPRAAQCAAAQRRGGGAVGTHIAHASLHRGHHRHRIARQAVARGGAQPVCRVVRAAAASGAQLVVQAAQRNCCRCRDVAAPLRADLAHVADIASACREPERPPADFSKVVDALGVSFAQGCALQELCLHDMRIAPLDRELDALITSNLLVKHIARVTSLTRLSLADSVLHDSVVFALLLNLPQLPALQWVGVERYRLDVRPAARASFFAAARS